MAKQRETTHIAEPFNNHLRAMGWTVDNVHGNQYQMGFPDVYIHRSDSAPKWVEYKVFYGNSVKITPAQRANFPLWISHNIPIWVIASDDLRGKANYSKRVRLYKKLFEEPNAHWLFSKSTHQMLR